MRQAGCYSAYQLCCAVLQEYPSGTAMMAAGVAGGVFAAAASHPFDTIKTRMQAYMYSRPEYSTTWTAAKTIYNEGGILKFWSGLTPRMTRIIGECLDARVMHICSCGMHAVSRPVLQHNQQLLARYWQMHAE